MRVLVDRGEVVGMPIWGQGIVVDRAIFRNVEILCIGMIAFIRSLMNDCRIIVYTRYFVRAKRSCEETLTCLIYSRPGSLVNVSHIQTTNIANLNC